MHFLPIRIRTCEKNRQILIQRKGSGLGMQVLSQIWNCTLKTKIRILTDSFCALFHSVAEPPLFWVAPAPAPGGQSPGASSGSRVKKAAPGGSSSIPYRTRTKLFFFACLKDAAGAGAAFFRAPGSDQKKNLLRLRNTAFSYIRIFRMRILIFWTSRSGFAGKDPDPKQWCLQTPVSWIGSWYLQQEDENN